MGVWSHASIALMQSHKTCAHSLGPRSFIMCVRPIHCSMVDNVIKMKETTNYINNSLNADKE
jgi:hypothetical protein